MTPSSRGSSRTVRRSSPRVSPSFLARHISPQHLTSCYLVALDLENGDVRWSRFVSSAGGLRHADRPVSSMRYEDGDLYVANMVGAIARVRPHNGEIVWLRKYGVPLGLRQIERRPWEFSTPALTDDFVFALRPDQRWVVALDRERGDQVDQAEATTDDGWRTPRYLLASTRTVYAVSDQSVIAFDQDNLHSPLWRLPAPVSSSVVGGSERTQSSASATITMQGRVQLTDRSLIIPANDEVMLVDSETGQVSHRVTGTPAGNPIAADSELVVASQRSRSGLHVLRSCRIDASAANCLRSVRSPTGAFTSAVGKAAAHVRSRS